MGVGADSPAPVLIERLSRAAEEKEVVNKYLGD
jgi:hypothetical protein